MNSDKIRELAEGNCGIVRFRGKAAYGKDMSPRTEMPYKADGAGELAQHSEALSSAPEVNGGVVYRNNALLPGEASPCRFGGFQSTREAGAPVAAMRRAGRSEESAEGIVVVMQSVSSLRWVTHPVKNAASRGGRRPEPKRRRMLIRLGVSPDEVKKASRSRKGYWRMSRNSLVNQALNNDYLRQQGVPFHARPLGSLQIRRAGENLTSGH